MEPHLMILYFSLFISLFFEVFLLITYIEVRGQIKLEDKWTTKSPKDLPTVTVIIPCFNEEKTVIRTVESVLGLDYPREKLFLILVNDGSNDGTLAALNKFGSLPNVMIINKENGGKHTAVNAALEHVHTDLVGCLDADSFVSQDALEKIIPYFDDHSVMAVTPSIKVYEPNSFLQYIQKMEYSWSIFLRRMLASLGALYVTPGPFSIFRSRVFKELGGYKYAHMTEDMEMAMRMQKHRYKIVNSHGAHVYTVTPATLKGLIKQRSRWAYGFLNNAFDYRELFFKKRHGHFGMFIMPIAVVSTFTSFVIVSNVIRGGMIKGMELITRYQAVGLNWNMSLPSFDWYFINTGTLTFVVMTALVLTLAIIYLALRLSEGKFELSRSLFYYLFVYAFLTPLWLIKALFDIVARRKVTWR
ncbi:MAG: glycosyltransferase [Parcubacteria group bacterium]